MESVLNQAHESVQFTIDEVEVSWLGLEHLIALRIVEVEASDTAGNSIVDIPALAVTFSRAALQAGVIAPKSVQIVKPNLWLAREADGAFSLAVSEDEGASEPMIDTLFSQLNAPDDPNNRLSYLEQIQIFDATLNYTDRKLGSNWFARIDNASLIQAADGILVDMNMRTDAETESANLRVQGAFGSQTKKLGAQIDFSDLNPATVSDFAPAMMSLAAVDVPLSGSLDVQFSSDGSVETAEAVIRGDEGFIRPSLLIEEEGSETATESPLAIKLVSANAAYDGENAILSVTQFVVEFADGATLALPAPLNHAMPLKRIGLTGQGSESEIDIETLELDLDGVVITAHGKVDSPLQSPKIAVHAETTRVRFDDLARYWPPSLAPGAYDWVINHLFDGTATFAEIDVALSEDDAEIILDDVTGRIEAEGVKVDFLPPLPPVLDASGTATFDDKAFTINLTGGYAGEKQVTGGVVSIYDFDGEVERLGLDLSIASPVRSALLYINKPPLELLDGFAMDVDTVSGDAAVRVQMDFALLKDLLIEDIDLTVIGELNDVGISGLIEDDDITNGHLNLAIDTDGMDIDGPITLADIPGYMTWTENFLSSAEMRRQIRLSVKDANANDITRVGFGTVDLSPYLKAGLVAGDARYEESTDGSQQFDINIDLTAAEAVIPELNRRKPIEEPGQLRLSGRLQDGELRALDQVTFSTSDIYADGSLQFRDGALHQVNLRRFTGPLTDVIGNARQDEDGVWLITFGGAQFNLASLVESSSETEDVDEGDSDTSGSVGLPDLILSGKIDTVWVGEGASLQNFDARLTVKDTLWEDLWVKATDSAGTPWSASIGPGEPNKRLLEIRSGDAGRTLRSLRIYDHMRGGKLTINGEFDDSKPSHPLDGRLKVKEFRLEEAPLLARLLTVTSFTGIANNLTGRGISVTELNAPFLMENGLIILKDARMYGSALGLTAEGDINTQSEMLDIRGTVVPFYTVNSVLGRIPLIGNVFSGGEKGGGVFAATYRIAGDAGEPDISYNALATLAPGFLRNLFNVFEGDPQTSTEAPVVDRSPASGNDPNPAPDDDR
jgi:hypothetical protein